jgi:hypothetical protein
MLALPRSIAFPVIIWITHALLLSCLPCIAAVFLFIYALYAQDMFAGVRIVMTSLLPCYCT